MSHKSGGGHGPPDPPISTAYVSKHVFHVNKFCVFKNQSHYSDIRGQRLLNTSNISEYLQLVISFIVIASLIIFYKFLHTDLLEPSRPEPNQPIMLFKMPISKLFPILFQLCPVVPLMPKIYICEHSISINWMDTCSCSHGFFLLP